MTKINNTFWYSKVLEFTAESFIKIINLKIRTFKDASWT